MMILTLNNLAKAYKLLPSEALARATTFDLYVLDVASRHVKYQQEVAEGKRQAKQNYGLSTEQMKAMLAAAKKAPPMKRKGAKK